MGETIKLSAPGKEFWEIPILFEDEHLLALDKPAGLVTSPGDENPNCTSLLGLLHEGIRLNKPWAAQRALSFLMNAHWLDFETSGALIFAKNKQAQSALANLFGSEKPFKRFLALVHGWPSEEKFEVDAKLSPNEAKPGTMRADRQGKKSKTQFEVVETFKNNALLHCFPVTDRMHQIRVHLKFVGLPVVADDLYGGRPLLLSRLKPDYTLKPGRQERPLIATPALHLEQLDFPHPITGDKLTISASWPKDLTVAVKYLRQYAVKAS